MGTIGFSQGFLLPATNQANIERVPLVCRGIVGIQFESLLELSLSSGKIPVVRHLVAAQIDMGTSQGRIAVLYADLGDRDQAFQWLNTAYQERDYFLLNLKTDFLLDPIRSDPRFAELMRKMGLPQ